MSKTLFGLVALSALVFPACGDRPTDTPAPVIGDANATAPAETPAEAPTDAASAQANLRIEYYEISKR